MRRRSQPGDDPADRVHLLGRHRPRRRHRPDSGGAGAAAATLTPTANYIELTCSDAEGCTITLSETTQFEGVRITITNISANNCTFADTAGVTEIAGALTMGTNDVLDLAYTGETRVERGRSDN